MSTPLDLDDVLARYLDVPDPVAFLADFLHAEGATEVDVGVLLFTAVTELNCRREPASPG